MKRFSFRLESILSLKKSLELQKQNEIAQIDEEISRINTGILCVDREFAEKKEEVMTRLANGETANVLSNFTQYFLALRDKRKDLEKQLEGANRIREMLRKELITIVTERKAIEQLKEKQFREYLYELKIEQQKEVDDLLSCKVAGDLA